MSLNMKRIIIAVIGLFFLGSLLIVGAIENNKRTLGKKAAIKVSAPSKNCVDCHTVKNPSLVEQWRDSKHAIRGVACMDCHEAQKTDVDAWEHEGYSIAVIVSPKDCSKCHARENQEFQESHHADAAKIIGSLDNVLAEVVEGNMGRLGLDGNSPVAVNGCWQCHGSVVKIGKDGRPTPATWPNTGIGRINPDGSKGSCTACHSRHTFSPVVARQPDSCGKCHLGPDHPQKEIYEESKHGIAFKAFKEYMKLDAQPWRVGIEYTAAPTCATCHMSATQEQNVTHDVGRRISWNLRPPISEKIDAKAIKAGKLVESWEQRRKNMKNVCSKCHSGKYVDGFYIQFDSAINLYNEKYGIPSTKIIKMMKAGGVLTATAFDEELEWTYFYLWHHEGRRARHGAAMMAPDYTQWHGFFELAERFYIHFVPQVKEACEKAIHEGGDNVAAAKEVLKELDTILNKEEHRWFLGKMSDDEKASRKAAAEEFKKRYAQN
ncbi:cytochrome c3 family protein [bacterium AH-315-C08]|nr:cytochrome c3 family protein [bacterium AH-315-C08]